MFNEEASAWFGKKALLQIIEDDTALAADSILQIFYDSAYNAPVKLLDSVITLCYDSMFTEAEDLNNSIVPGNDIEALIKAMNYYFIYEKFDTTSLSSGDITELQYLAGQCPFVYGPAVYSARVILAGIEADSIIYISSCEQNTPEARLANPVHIQQGPRYLLYPNPANDRLIIEIFNTDSIAGKLELYNFLGKKMFEQVISASPANVSLAGIPSGIYLCVLKENNNRVYSQKLIIIK